jgi:hypothetical protein
MTQEQQRCRRCGCTHDRACIREAGMLDEPTDVFPDGTPIVTCGWAEPDLCTACLPEAGDDWSRPEATPEPQVNRGVDPAPPDERRAVELYRQGDVLIARTTEVPAGLEAVPLEQGRVVLAHGEVTGHAHVVHGECELLAADVEDLEERFLRVEQEAQVVHDEHDTITLPPGDYHVTRQREYSPEEIRRVAD